MKAGEPEDGITELLVMIRRRSGDTNAPEERNPADAKGLLEKTESTQMLEILSSEHLPAVSISTNNS
jgi:hypothetical protein